MMAFSILPESEGRELVKSTKQKQHLLDLWCVSVTYLVP